MRARWHKCESRWHMQIPGKRYMVDDGFVVMKAGKLSKKGTNTCCVCSAIHGNGLNVECVSMYLLLFYRCGERNLKKLRI